MKKTIKLLFAVALMLLVISPISVFALGQIVQPIVMENALRGQNFQEIITVVNTDKKEIVVDLASEDQIKGWVKFYKINNLKNATSSFKILPNATLNIAAIFTIPEGTPNGEYKGFVSAIQRPDAQATKDKSSAGLAQRIDREVTIKVTDQELMSFEASVIPHSYDLNNNEPLKVRIIYDNRGNININPEMKVSVKSLDGQVLYGVIVPYPADKPVVNPHSIMEITSIEIPTNNLQKGKYIADIDFMQNNKVQLNKHFKFSIGNTRAVLGLKLFNSNNYWIFAIGIVALLLIALAIYQTIILIKKRKALVKNNINPTPIKRKMDL